MRRLLRLLPVGLLASATIGQPAFGQSEPLAGEWPQWRGPDRTGVSKERGLLKAWPREGPALAWKATGLGAGYSTIAVVGDTLFTMGGRGDADNEQEFVIALDAATGKERWATAVGTFYRNNKGDGPRCTPTVDGDRLYALGANGDLVCLNTESGQVIWKKNVLEEFRGNQIGWGISESPLIDGDRVIVTPGGRDATIVALDKKSGSPAWKGKVTSTPARKRRETEAPKGPERPERPGYSSAVVGTVGGIRQIIQFGAGGVFAVDAADGRFLWQYKRPANGTANVTTPVFRDGLVFATSAYETGGGAVKLTADEGGVKAEEVYFKQEFDNHHGGVVLVGDHLYGFGRADLICMEFETGKIAWTNRSVGKGSLVYADGMLYCLSERNAIALVEATPDAYREHGRFTIPRGKNPSWSHPVVAAGRLYIRDQDVLYAFDVRGRE